MKKARILAAALLCAVLFLTGCGEDKSDNVMQGMQQIEALDYEGALASFDAATVNKENPQMVARGKGLAYMGLTQYDQAVEFLEKALTYSDEKPDQIDYDINYYLATAYYKSGQPDKAIKVYEAVTAMRPKEKDAYYLKGVIELEQGDVEAAMADFDRAVQIDEKDYDLRINIACSCYDNGQEETGKSYLQAVLDENDKSLSDYNRGRISFYLGEYENARDYLERAKEEGGVEAVNLLGQTYEKLQDYNYAASVYSRFLENKGGDARIYNQLGLCQLKNGDYSSALANFQAAMQLEGTSMTQTLKYNEIVAYEYLGDFKQATVLMEKYLGLYPDDEKAKREYEFLKTR